MMMSQMVGWCERPRVPVTEFGAFLRAVGYAYEMPAGILYRMPWGIPYEMLYLL